MPSETTPTTIEHSLTLDILRGRYAAGSRLPPVRELAETFGVNPATIQRVVARLETRGLITARQGSGLRVNDPTETGDLSLTPLWLEASLGHPQRAIAILRDLLELRRAVAIRLMVSHRERILEASAELEALATRMFEASRISLDAYRDADIALARAILRASGNTVALAVFNTLARVLTELPVVAQAMYGWPDEGADSQFHVLALLAQNAPDVEARIDAAMSQVDNLTVERFSALLDPRGDSE